MDTFAGWSLSENGETLGNNSLLVKDTTYYAIYSVIITVGEEHQTYSSSNPNSLTIEKLGEGNWKLKDGNGEILLTNTLLINGATYNKYEGNIINITLSINGTTQKKAYEENRTIADLTTPTIEGYTFIGWSLSENGYILEDSEELIANSTYYAIYGDKISVTLNDGTFAKTYYFSSTATVGNLPTISQEGYTFVGWSLNENGETLDNSTLLNADKTYYAVLRENNV